MRIFDYHADIVLGQISTLQVMRQITIGTP